MTILEQDLARQVGLVDDVAVGEQQASHAGTHQRLGQEAAERAAADQEHARTLEARLALRSERGEADLAFEAPLRSIVSAGVVHSSHHTRATRPIRASSAAPKSGSSARASLSTGLSISTQLK